MQIVVRCFWPESLLNVSGFRSENKNYIDVKLELLVNRLFQQRCISPVIVSMIPYFYLFIYFVKHSFFFYKFIYFISLWLRWVFVAARGLSLVAGSGGYSSLWCAGFSLWWLLLLRSAGSGCVASVVVAHGLSCSAARGIFPDQGSNPCPLHWQADS